MQLVPVDRALSIKHAAQEALTNGKQSLTFILAGIVLLCLLGVVWASFEPQETAGKSTSKTSFGPETEVQYYSDGDWKTILLRNLSPGDQFKAPDKIGTYKGEKYLCYLDKNGELRLNTDIPLSKLDDAERPFDSSNNREPGSQDVVRFIDKKNSKTCSLRTNGQA